MCHQLTYLSLTTGEAGLLTLLSLSRGDVTMEATEAAAIAS